MPDIKYTPSQNAAVRYGDGDILLSAAAGSGKTAVLTGRIVNIIEEGRASLPEMLVVTFARDAAAEMRSRISSRLTSLASELSPDETEKRRRITKAAADIPSADICTIDSFLFDSLKQYLPAIGFPENTRIGETQSCTALKNRTMKKLIEDMFCEENTSDMNTASFSELADVFSGTKNSQRIDDQCLKLHEKLTSSGLESSFLSEEADRLDGYVLSNTDFLDTPYGCELLSEIEEFTVHYRNLFSAIREYAGDDKKFNDKPSSTMDSDIGILDAIHSLIEKHGTSEEFLRFFSEEFTFQRLSAKGCEPAVIYSDYRNDFKKKLKKLQNKVVCDIKSFGISCNKTARILRKLSEVMRRFDAELLKEKQESGIIEFSDLSLFALKLFIDRDGNPTETAHEIGSKYRYIFIDEYQDTNDVQDRIFRSISGNSVRFMVGDIKQSIYGFRSAEPSVFSGYRNRWGKISPDDIPDTGTGHSMFMSENFRCAEPIVNFVNEVSKTILPYGDTPFTDDDLLIHARGEGYSVPKSEFVRIINPYKDKKEETEENITADESTEKDDIISEDDNKQAVYVAKRISEMLGNPLPSGEICTPGDIVILKRTLKNAGEYVKALEDAGIPCKADSDNNLGEYKSVSLLWSIINFIDNPLNDIHLSASLRSPVFGFSLDDLKLLRTAAGKSKLWNGLNIFAEKKECGDFAEKCAEILNWHKRMTVMSSGLSIGRFLEYLLNDTSILSIEGIRENAPERDALLAFCHSSGTDPSFSLTGFLSFASELLDTKMTGESGSTDCVRIMTIHKSKGLEFPVVIIPDTEKSRNTKDEKYALLFDKKTGFGINLPDDSGLVMCRTPLHNAAVHAMSRKSISEEMRILYVAMTRAREILIVTGLENATKDVDPTEKPTFVFSDGYSLMEASNMFYAWLKAAFPYGSTGQVEVKTIITDEITSNTTSVFSDNEDIYENESALFRERFAFSYDNSLSSVPAKLSVSKLYPEMLDPESESVQICFYEPEVSEEVKLKKPDFMTGHQADGAEKGTATHVFMQFTDFRLLKEKGFEAERTRLVEKGFMPAAQADLVNEKMIERFRHSGLIDSMLKSEYVRREFRFNVRMPASRFTTDSELAEKLDSNGTKLTVQGVVDCVFRDSDTGDLILIDYKTDSLTEEEWKDRSLAFSKLRKRHMSQLSYYKEICSDMFCENVKAFIYSTVLGECIEV